MKKLLFIALLGLSVVSCKKEGCTDSNAKNFDEKAKKDDNSCSYEGSCLFWYDQITSSNMIADGIGSLKIYVNGTLIGSTGTDVYWNGSPDCGQTGSITYLKDMGGSESLSFSYEVYDDFDILIWSGTGNFTANGCQAIKLVY